jgi:gluconate 5-dehydrogenase
MLPVTFKPMKDQTAMFRLDNKLALVTGSSAGIGYALADALASAGAAVVLNGRNKDSVSRSADRLRTLGHSIYEMPFDVTHNEEVERAIESIELNIGPIEILVNNAGMQHRAPLHEFPEAMWHEMMHLNMDSVFYLSKAVALKMIPRSKGKIINICSVQSELGRPNIAPYTASKGAVKMLTKGMAIDWGRYGLCVNGLGPGYFKTELTETLVQDEKFTAWLTSRTPSGRWGEVSELGGAIIFLASEASNFVNGHILYVDGGVTATL